MSTLTLELGFDEDNANAFAGEYKGHEIVIDDGNEGTPVLDKNWSSTAGQLVDSDRYKELRVGVFKDGQMIMLRELKNLTMEKVTKIAMDMVDNYEVGFVKVLCEDQYYRIKHPTLDYTINFIESVDNHICWCSKVISINEEKGTRKESFIGYGVMSEKEIDGYIQWLNVKFNNGYFKNHKPKKGA